MSRLALLLAIITFPSIVPAAAAAAAEWTDHFRDGGKMLDAGSNLYVAARTGRMQMINRWDLNNDGHLDLILPSGHAHTEKENTYIYLNTGDDIDGRTLIELPANGSTDGVIGDFNKDGFNDLAVCNGDNGITTWTDAYIYFGAKDGFSVSRRITLPAQSSTSIAAGDFDGDGWVDLAVACQWRAGDVVHPTGPKQSFVYWNGADGFAAAERSAFTFDGEGAVAVAAGKLSGKDAPDDLVMMTASKTFIYHSTGGRFDSSGAKRIEIPFTAQAASIGDINKDGNADLALCGPHDIAIFRGSSSGAIDPHPIHLAAKTPRDVVLRDLNNDGLDDVAIANYTGEDGAPWINSYVYFSDGKDFSSAKPIELPTMGARAISAADLNADGLPELIISNERVTNELAIPSLIYWNEAGSFRPNHRTELPTQGCIGNAVGDVNHDGKPDVVFFNFEGHFRDGASNTRIYWGDGTRDYSPQRALDIPTHYITSVAHADLDDDGHVDLVLTQSRFISGVAENLFCSTIVCWGDKEKPFERRTLLTVDYLAGGVRIADLNRDGWLDLIVGATSTDPADAKRKGIPIFWGSPSGFAQRKRTIVTPAGDYPRCPLVADVNHDGYLDLVNQAAFGAVLTWWGSAAGGFDTARTSEMKLDRDDQLVFIDAADLNKDGWLDLILPCRLIGKDAEVSSFVYYGSKSGFASERRAELPVKGPYETSVADLDKDGWLDVFLTSYKGNLKRNWPSMLYWGGKDGLRKRPPLEVPSYAASGVETADYDGDGFIDILLSNHRSDGSTDQPIPHNHRAPSMLYWGGPEGFSPTRRWEAIGNGPHAMNLRDVGNAIDRGLYEDYISPPRAFETDKRPATLSWKAQTPLGTSVKFDVRYAATADALEQAKWQPVERSGAALSAPDDARHMQYRARLVSPNGGATPYLESVTVTFAQ